MNCPICSNVLIYNGFYSNNCDDCSYAICLEEPYCGNETITFNGLLYVRRVSKNEGVIKDLECQELAIIPMIPINKDTYEQLTKRLTKLLAFL